MLQSFLSALSLISATNATITGSLTRRVGVDLSYALLPRNSRSSLIFDKLFFRNLDLVHFSPVTFHSCKFSSPVHLESRGPISIQNCVNLMGTVDADQQDVLVEKTKVARDFVQFSIKNSKQAIFKSTEFHTTTDKPIIQLLNSDAMIDNCNFTGSKTSGVYAVNSNLDILSTTFRNMMGENGGAVFFQGKEFHATNCLFINCTASKNGGALYLLAKNGVVAHSTFYRTQAKVGPSVFSVKSIIISGCSYERPFKDEFVGSIGISFLTNTVSFLPPPTPSLSPTATTIIFNATTPMPTRTIPDPTMTPVSFNPNPTKDTTYITFVIVICVVVVVIVIVIVVVVVIQKRKNQIYPSDDEEETEPKKTTVIVKNMYSVQGEIP